MRREREKKKWRGQNHCMGELGVVGWRYGYPQIVGLQFRLNKTGRVYQPLPRGTVIFNERQAERIQAKSVVSESEYPADEEGLPVRLGTNVPGT